MKRRNLFIATGLALGIAAGISLGMGLSQSAISAMAASAVSGTISVDLTGGDWATNAAGQNVSVFFFNDSEGKSAWGSYEFAAQYQYVVFVDYNLSFTPQGMIAVRYDGNQQESTWSGLVDRFSTKWNQTCNLGFSANSNILIEDWNEEAKKNDAIVGSPYLSAKSAETSWNYQQTGLSTVRLNPVNNHVLYSLNKTFTQYEQGEVKIYDTGYGYDAAVFKHLETGNWGKNDGWFFQYNGSSSIDLTFWFDRNAGTLEIYEPNYAAADNWSLDFLGGDCGHTKSAWVTSATSWAALPSTARTIFTGLKDGDENGEYYEHAVARYDLIETQYGKSLYSEFMGREDAGNLNPKASGVVSGFSQKSHDSLIVFSAIMVGATLTVTAGYVFLRKKKED